MDGAIPTSQFVRNRVQLYLIGMSFRLNPTTNPKAANIPSVVDGSGTNSGGGGFWKLINPDCNS